MVKQTESSRGILRTPGYKLYQDGCDFLSKTKTIPMHGISEPRLVNLNHDSCAYNLSISESMAPGLYNLNQRVHYDSCMMNHPGFIAHNQSGGILASHVDVDSELRNLNYINSKCPESRYNPMKDTKYKQLNDKPSCSTQLIPKYTKQPKACNDITSQNINRFEPLCVDVQKINRIHSNDYFGKPTRLMMKDLTTHARKNCINK